MSLSRAHDDYLEKLQRDRMNTAEYKNCKKAALFLRETILLNPTAEIFEKDLNLLSSGLDKSPRFCTDCPEMKSFIRDARNAGIVINDKEFYSGEIKTGVRIRHADTISLFGNRKQFYLYSLT